ncbi:unnamed protein product [Sphenostylis stenocarpa]|uniref:Uncharacterized protein n=1 Tax=Sphenostylis stenocarpa TaxID=92480 RepID=A0AA86SZM3_9FABA|nr:unnamed protein product [Sphenostylis stenocarpa]
MDLEQVISYVHGGIIILLLGSTCDNFVHVFHLMMIVFGIWEAEKAMLVRFNPKADLHEAVKYDLRLSRANITLSLMSPPNCCFPAHPNSSDSLVRISLPTSINFVITNISFLVGPIFN